MSFKVHYLLCTGWTNFIVGYHGYWLISIQFSIFNRVRLLHSDKIAWATNISTKNKIGIHLNINH